MKKLTLLLSVMLFAWATNLWAETYTITFLTGSNSSTAMTETTEVSKVVAASSVDYIAGFTSNCKKAYHASTSGLKLGSGGNEGTLEFTLAEVCKANVTMITVKTTQYSQETPTISLYVNGGTTALSSAGPKEDIVHSFATAQEVSTIKVVSALGSATGKNTRSYLSSIIIETAAADAPTLKTLTVSGTPKKTNYEEGETFDPTGLVVTGTYSDGNPQSIAEGITWLINPDPLTAGTTTVEVIASVKNAAGKDVTSDVYEVTGLTVTAAKTLTSIAVSGTPAEFWKGDTFNHDGMTVTANWDDNSTTDVTAEAEFSAPDMTTAGVKTITVTYKDKTATYDITVKTIANTQETAYTTDQAIALIDAGKDLTSHVYVKGTISQIDNYSSGTITYWLDQNTFEVYKGKNLNNTNFTAVDDVVKGAEVIVYGQITKFGSTYELNTGNYLVSYTDPAVIKQEPTLALGTYKTSMDANEANDEYSVTYDGDGTLSVTSSNEEVATVTIKGTNIVVDALTEGTTTISVAATETDTYYFVEKKYTLTVYPAWVVASLPFEFDGGKSDINQGNGMKQNGIESKDYSSSPKLKFGETDASLIIWFNETAASVSYDIKGYPATGNTTTSGTFAVLRSEDNQKYDTVATHDNLTTTKQTETKMLSSSTRYIKFVYSKKSSGNVALGAIKIAKPSDPSDPSTPTAIDNTAVETPAVKTIENGQLVIIRDGKKYNAMGVRLQ